MNVNIYLYVIVLLHVVHIVIVPVKPASVPPAVLMRL